MVIHFDLEMCSFCGRGQRYYYIFLSIKCFFSVLKKRCKKRIFLKTGSWFIKLVAYFISIHIIPPF